MERGREGGREGEAEENNSHDSFHRRDYALELHTH